MKKRFLVLLLIVLFPILGIGVQWICSDIEESYNSQGAKQRIKKAGSYVKPDLEYLNFYGLDAFDTALPVIFIDTKQQVITKENNILASMKVINQPPLGKTINILDAPNDSFSIAIKYRGASSYSQFDKKQYRVKFVDEKDSEKEKKFNFLGMGKSSEWVLNGPFLDKSLIRNKLVYDIGRDLFEWAPDSRYVEVFVDGKYDGVYLAVEPVTNGESRLRLSKFGLLSGETAYILKRDRIGTETDPIDNFGTVDKKTYNELYISYPPTNRLTDVQIAWIERDVSRFEEVLYSDNFDDPKFGYEKYIDVDCFVDYFILNEVTMNNDAGNLSTYPYKELNGKIKLAIWDYNNCYDNYQWFQQDFEEFFLVDNSWFDRLLCDKRFVDKVVARYKELRKDILSQKNLYNRIDLYQEMLGNSIDRNFSVWGYSYSLNLLNGSGREIESYEQAIAQLKQAINKRFSFLDENIEKLYSYSNQN